MLLIALLRLNNQLTNSEYNFGAIPFIQTGHEPKPNVHRLSSADLGLSRRSGPDANKRSHSIALSSSPK